MMIRALCSQESMGKMSNLGHTRSSWVTICDVRMISHVSPWSNLCQLLQQHPLCDGPSSTSITLSLLYLAYACVLFLISIL